MTPVREITVRLAPGGCAPVVVGDSFVSSRTNLGSGGPGLALLPIGVRPACTQITVAYPYRHPGICRDSPVRRRGCPSRPRPLALPCTQRRRVSPHCPTTVVVRKGLETGPSKDRSRHRDRRGRLPRPRGDIGVGQQSACLRERRQRRLVYGHGTVRSRVPCVQPAIHRSKDDTG